MTVPVHTPMSPEFGPRDGSVESLAPPPMVIPELGQTRPPEVEHAELWTFHRHLDTIRREHGVANNIEAGIQEMDNPSNVFTAIDRHRDFNRQFAAGYLEDTQHDISVASESIGRMLQEGNTGALLNHLEGVMNATTQLERERRVALEGEDGRGGTEAAVQRARAGHYDRRGRWHPGSDQQFINSIVAAQGGPVTRRHEELFQAPGQSSNILLLPLNLPHGLRDLRIDRGIEAAHRETVANDHGNSARERARRETLHQSAEACFETYQAVVARDRARMEHVQTLGLGARLRGLYEGERTAHEARVSVVHRGLEAVNASLGMWAFGEGPRDGDHAPYLLEDLNNIGELIARMSPLDQDRNFLLRDHIRLVARVNQRIILAGMSEGSYPMFTRDRGILVETADGGRVIYDDGSMRDASGVRRNADGSEWREGTEGVTPWNSADEEHLRSMNNESLGNTFVEAFDRWEEARTPESEIEAAHTTRVCAERLEDQATDHASENEARTTAYQTATDRWTQAVGSRDHDIEQQLSASMHGRRDTSGDLRAEITQRVDEGIARLADERRAAHTQLVTAEGNMHHSRTLANQMQYIRGFFAVTQKAAAEGDIHSPATAEMRPDGAIAWKDTTMNGQTERSDWVVFPNGSSAKLNPDRTIERYDPAGRRL